MLRKDKVIICQLIGGLGNQMFQYVFYKYLSLVKNIELELDLSGFGTHIIHNGYGLNSVFGIEENIAPLTRILKYKSKSSLFFKIENKFLLNT
ncbi:hypothetical protein ACH24_04070 [Francisella persica ATCC VR-331]|uniref:Alpha-1,2-fucosyltransferase n=1 Tax=Francisella persica ATCC VR-331 TaxID=1086726 RepID=A0AAC8ZMQ4_9GAMM|nr:hypothetical protein [Francisella persica]ALB01846.1 hypothetical protein ACH24_04070 [Francisella persica ATCC VR-331]ANH77096.1 hypothetical protein FSC845_00160 [Francisella persica ATCC VR-331]